MTTWAIGDIQGCYDQLIQLLDRLALTQTDQVWFVGDLVNRGPQSLKVIEHIKHWHEVGKAKVVLGNHDLRLLLALTGHVPLTAHDTLADVMASPNAHAIQDWLISLPLLHHDNALNMTMVHAGVYPTWSLSQAQHYAHEVEEVLKNNNFDLLANLYGNEPDQWSESLTGVMRWRFIINAFTRMRVVDHQARLQLSYQSGLADIPEGFRPWYAYENRPMSAQNIVFGHWAGLNADVRQPHIIATDTGCVWGGKLTAVDLQTGIRVCVDGLAVK